MKLEIISSALESTEKLNLPLSSQSVHAGFPSPADDHIEASLDLNRALIKHPSATFFVRVDGESMRDRGINHDDILVVDRSIEPYSGAIAVCFLDGEFTLKQIDISDSEITLVPANEKFSPIKVSKDDDFTIWGIVTYSIKKHI